MPLDAPGLAEHLRATVVNQVAIDQPRYSGFRTAVEYAHPTAPATRSLTEAMTRRSG